MTAKKMYAYLLVFLLISAGCTGKEKIKPSADSMTAQNTINAVNLVKDAYLQKDVRVLQEQLEPALSDEVISQLFFDKAELSLTPRMIRIKDSVVTVQINWQCEWTAKGRAMKNSGVSTLVFKKDNMKLIQIEGDKFFHMPSFRQ